MENQGALFHKTLRSTDVRNVLGGFQHDCSSKGQFRISIKMQGFLTQDDQVGLPWWALLAKSCTPDVGVRSLVELGPTGLEANSYVANEGREIRVPQLRPGSSKIIILIKYKNKKETSR